MISSYGEHQGVMGLLATHSDAILSTLNIALVDFLVLYSDETELAHQSM